VGAGFELAERTIDGPGLGDTAMPTSTSWASSISQHIRAAKETLRDAIFDAKYVWSCQIRRAKGLKFEATASRRP
jgi:hypothetical protein